MALNIIGRAFGWLGRRLLLYALLVCAIGFATFALPWIKREIEGDRQAQQRYEALDLSRRQLDREIATARDAIGTSVAATRQQGVAALDARIALAEREKAALEQVGRNAPSTFVLALQGRDALLAAKRRELHVLMLDREIGALRAARSLALADRASIAAATDLQAQRAAAQAAIHGCDGAREDLAAFEQRWRWRVRSWLDNDEHRALAARTATACAEARRQVGRHNLLAATSREAALARTRAEALLAGSETEAGARLDAWQERFAADVDRARTEWAGNWSERARLWADRLGLRPILIAAAWALLAILLTPYAIRLAFFFLLAPMAMRRAAIRLSVPGGGGTAIPLPGPSTTSVAIRLDRGEELLVRQDYLQSTSHGGAKATRWLLDYRHPLSSLVSGLAFLTRIRGDGETTTISAVRDPFAETVLLSLPEGAACVLQPRALAAVAQPIGRPLRISSHWRLFSLNAWLTLQLRYLVFHGPTRLALKGGRGVRVERAEQGRVFGQDQLVGFSADLAYSVARTETFWPYFLGREQLFKDRVEAGDGLLIVEEAPMAGRGRGEARHGLEGTADAMLKLVGL
ncbi:hypothetical protein [Sphingomonas sp. YL-JM2C]